MTLIGGYLAIVVNDGIKTHHNSTSHQAIKPYPLRLPPQSRPSIPWDDQLYLPFFLAKITSGGQNRHVLTHTVTPQKLQRHVSKFP